MWQLSEVKLFEVKLSESKAVKQLFEVKLFEVKMSEVKLPDSVNPSMKIDDDAVKYSKIIQFITRNL